MQCIPSSLVSAYLSLYIRESVSKIIYRRRLFIRELSFACKVLYCINNLEYNILTACYVKLCLRFLVHALFLAVKYKKHVQQQCNISHSSNYFNKLQKDDKAEYKLQLTLTNGHLLPHPYGIVENWKNDVKLILDVSWGDMYNYLVNSLNEYIQNNLKAYKLPVAINFLYATMFNTFIIMKLQKNLHF